MFTDEIIRRDFESGEYLWIIVEGVNADIIRD